VIERLPVEVVDRLAVRRSRREQQQPARRDVSAEDREHGALVLNTQVEEAVPGDDGAEGFIQRQRAHVAHHPRHGRKTLGGQGDHGGRCIDAGHAAAGVDQIAGDGLARAAAEIQHMAVLGVDQRQERVEIGALHEVAATIPVERRGVLLVELLDLGHARLSVQCGW